MEVAVNTLERNASKPLLDALLGCDTGAQRAALSTIISLAAHLPTYIFAHIEQLAVDSGADSENRFVAAEFLLHSVGNYSKYTFFDKQALWPTGVAYRIKNPIAVCRAILQRAGQGDEGRNLARNAAIELLKTLDRDGIDELVNVAASEFLPLKIRQSALELLGERGQFVKGAGRGMRLANIVVGPRLPSEALAISVYTTLAKIGDHEALLACYTHEVPPITGKAKKILLTSLKKHGIGWGSRVLASIQTSSLRIISARAFLTLPWRRVAS